MCIETPYKEYINTTTERLGKENLILIVEEIELTTFPNTLIEIVKPPQELKKLHVSLLNDLLKLYEMCLFLGKQENKKEYYNLFFNIFISLNWFNTVEILLTNLIAFSFKKWNYKYYKNTKEFNKIYNKRLKETKKAYREYKELFSKIEKEYNNICSSLEKEYNKNKLCSLNMNTVYCGIVENNYKNLCSTNPNKITELVEGVTPVRITPQEEETVKEILKSRI